MLDLVKDRPISLQDVPAFLHRGNGGKPLHEKTIQKYINQGVRGRDGRRVKLRTFVIGGRRVTSISALEEWIALQNVATDQKLKRQPAGVIAEQAS